MKNLNIQRDITKRDEIIKSPANKNSYGVYASVEAEQASEIHRAPVNGAIATAFGIAHLVIGATYVAYTFFGAGSF